MLGLEQEGIHEGVTGIIGTMVSIMAFFGVRLIKQVDANTKELAEHRIDDAGKYATNADVKDSLERIHGRIDVVSEDIKTLLRAKK